MNTDDLSHRALTLGVDATALRRRWYREGFFASAPIDAAIAATARANPRTKVLFHSDLRPAEASLDKICRKGRALAGAFHALGLRKGDILAVQVPNWLEAFEIYAAGLALGLVILPIVHIYGPAEVSFILRESGARAFVIPDRWRQIDYRERLARLSDTPRLEHVIVIGEAPEGTISWEKLTAGAGDRFEMQSVAADDLALLIYTSGTTADPKGVQHSHNSLLAEMRAGQMMQQAMRPGATLSPWPSGHIAGVLSFLRFAVRGLDCVIMDQWNADDAAMLIERHNIAATSGTPYFATSLLDAAEAGRRDISSLTDYMVGAATVPPPLVARCERLGLKTYRCYGSSEHPSITQGLTDEPIEKRMSTDGRTTPGNEIRLVDDDGNDVPVGSEGEVVSRGPEQFIGYRKPELNEGSYLPGGWFKTGDLGRQDGEGFLTITDRKKDVIIRGGENISSREVEELLLKHDAVADVAVVAMPDGRLGENVCAFVVLRPGAALSADGAAKHFAALGVARQKTPERIIEVGELPRTAAGKVKKHELRARLK